MIKNKLTIGLSMISCLIFFSVSADTQNRNIPDFEISYNNLSKLERNKIDNAIGYAHFRYESDIKDIDKDNLVKIIYLYSFMEGWVKGQNTALNFPYLKSFIDTVCDLAEENKLEYSEYRRLIAMTSTAFSLAKERYPNNLTLQTLTVFTTLNIALESPELSIYRGKNE